MVAATEEEQCQSKDRKEGQEKEGKEIMPWYDYQCRSCDHEFTESLMMADRDKPTRRKCPECGKKLKKVSGKINPNTQGSGVINPKNEEEKKQGTSVGTGFFVDNKGHIVTNYHVVKSNENRSKIIFKNEETKVNVIAYDEILDIALLKAKVKNSIFAICKQVI